MMKRYFIVYAQYTRKASTGHLVEAQDRTDALRIAGTHKLCNSVNKEFLKGHKVIREVKKYSYQYNRRARHIGGKIWYEENGELKYYPKVEE